MSSLAEARRSAVYDVVRQVLRAVGADYRNVFVDVALWSVNRDETRRFVYDRLIGKSRGFLLGIEQNIVQSEWVQDNDGKYLCFILVRYPDNLLDEMRRLSKGARVIASPYKKDNRNLSFSLTETNGVSVVLSSAKVTVLRRNRFSNAVSFFIWPVPEGDTIESVVTFQPIRLRNNSSLVKFPNNDIGKTFKDYFLGAEIKRSAVFYGFDELGRTVTSTTEF